jgi:hypothetical protein
MENLAIIIDHLAFFTAIGNLLWQLGIFYTVLVHFSPFWYVVSRKIWQPCPVTATKPRQSTFSKNCARKNQTSTTEKSFAFRHTDKVQF